MSADVLITTDPATGRELGRYDVMSSADIDRVLEEVAAAQPAWAATPLEERTGVLLRTAELLRERSEELGALATAEMGKPITEAVAEVREVCLGLRVLRRDLAADAGRRAGRGGRLAQRRPL